MAKLKDDSNSGTDEEELRIRPAEGPSREEISRQLEPLGNYVPQPDERAQRLQFTIADVLVLMSAMSLGLAGGTWVPVQLFAAVMGLVMLCGLVIVHVYPPEAHWARLLWWSLGLAYTVSVLVAVLKPTSV